MKKIKLKTKKHITLFVLAFTMIMYIIIPGCTSASGKMAFNQLPKKDRSKLPRTIITTDMELDDTNGILLSLLYANEFDIAAIVFTSGMFHYNGNGGANTLKDVAPTWRTPMPDAGDFTEYRPVDPTLLHRIIDEFYREDYVYLSQNDPNYPTPDELLSITKTGNIEFEGDVRFDTEGSNLIKKIILDDDPRPLIIQSWGGSNSWVRALLSIYEEYKDTNQWAAIQKKVADKIYLTSSGEDNCRADQKIDEIFPGMHSYSARGGGGYGNYNSANTAGPDLYKYYQAAWLTDALKFDHGRLMGYFHLTGDGQFIEGDVMDFQYGLTTYIDLINSQENNVARPLFSVRQDFDMYDWMGCQFGNASFLSGFGLRGFVDGFFTNPNYGTIGGRITLDGQAMNRADNYNDNDFNPVTSTLTSAAGTATAGTPGGFGGFGGGYGSYWTNILFEEIAARADWTVKAYADCNHAPIVSSDNLDIYAKAGEVVDLRGSVVDPDGDQYNTKWWVWNSASEYDGVSKGRLDVWGQEPTSTKFTVPRDAQPGDYFNVLMEVRDVAERPMTRFAQFIVHVYDASTIPANVTGISINTPADKTEYVYGKPLDVAGLTIKVSKADGNDLIANVNNDMISGFDTRSVGNQTLTVSYGSFTTNYAVTVKQVGPIASPFAFKPVKGEYDKQKRTDRSKLPRTIITTDLEIDDMTGIMMSLMYADMFDIAGLVWSAGMFHWNGDGGVHTLGEITPNNRTPQVESDKLTSYRPVEPGWLNRMVSEHYAADYVYLSQNNPNYPTPEELLSVVKQGNIEFEGDVRFDTEGSDWIKQCVLDDDPRPLFIQSWGGANTWVRAFLSIYEDYKNTDQWATIRKKVVDKVYLMGTGEDHCMADQKIDEIYPGLRFYGGYGGSGGYGNYFAPNTASLDVRHFYQADWLTNAFKLNHGNVLGAWLLMGDGQEIWGEPDEFQYGLQTFIDFSSLYENNAKHDLSRQVRQDFDIYDWQGCQFGNTSFLTGFGLRGFVDGFPVNPNYGTIAGRISLDGKAMNRAGNYNDNEYNPVTNAPGSYGTRFTTILFEEIAARADWAVNTFENCNHAPVVGSDNLDIYAKAGEVVDLRGYVTDPDGDEFTTKWWVWNAASEYDGAAKGRLTVWNTEPTSAKFTVPRDAMPGDYFNVLMEVRDIAERPMTRFAQFIVHIYDASTVPGDVTGISINTPADQTAYVVGKPLKVDGLTIKAQRAGGEDLVVAVANAMITGFDNYFIGSQNLTIKYGNFSTNYMITVSPPALPATYAIYTNKPKNVVLEAATEGYAERAPEMITVSNRGKNALDLSISLSVRSANADAFVVSPGDVATLNAGNQTDRFAVRPASGLAPGTYTADVVIMDKALNIRAPEFTVSFTVNPRR